MSAAVAPETRPAQPAAHPAGGGRRSLDAESLSLAVVAIAWIAATLYFYAIEHTTGVVLALLGLICLVAVSAIRRWSERRRWVRPIHEIVSRIYSPADSPSPDDLGTHNPEIVELARAVKEIKEKLSSMREAGSGRNEGDNPFIGSGDYEIPRALLNPALSRSQIAETVPSAEPEAAAPGEMICRLDPRTLRWLESSVAEQDFLGYRLEQLRRMSFLDIIDLEDRELAKSQLAAAISKGEGHNLLYRIRTARDDLKAIELHVAVRYSPDARPHHVRVRMADMTKKVRAERELRRRTKELIDVNAQLRRINRELEDVKDRYSDLYQNAPAMYFSLDAQGTIVECNDTLLETLGLPRDSVVGQHYRSLLPEDRKLIFASWFGELKAAGRVELESRWTKADGSEIDVWVAATAVRGPDGSFRYSRSVARDVTARRRLEAELKDKNDRLARANDELWRKNKELDEFTFVIAHDLKEPVRTLIAFSDFLERDCGEILPANGLDSLRHIVEAARRMRSLIDDLSTLGRAGRVTGDFRRMKLEPVIDLIRVDFGELLRCRCARIEVVGDLPEVWGDPVRIGQLLGNLIGNGLKYNRSECPRVEVEWVDTPPDKAEGGFTSIAVRDNGIGIEPNFHARIFELFRRLHTRDEYEGTGAGLAICQKIAQAHGGRIWVESTPGAGSAFFVNLPLAAEPSSTPEPAAHAV